MVPYPAYKCTAKLGQPKKDFWAYLIDHKAHTEQRCKDSSIGALKNSFVSILIQLLLK